MNADLRGLVERWRQESELMDCDPDVFACLPKAYRDHADELEAALSVAQGQGFVATVEECAELVWHNGGVSQLAPGTKLYAAAPAQPDGVSK